MNNQHMGTLYIVSTPIGNLEDMTFRAVRILKEADLILAEDTRVTGRLLKHYEIDTRQMSYYAQNEKGRVPQVIRFLKEGKNLALVSDAGTPLLSDPGLRLVQAAASENIPVVPVPGASALLAAIVSSALPADRFVFEGFLPRKKGRQTKLRALALEPATIIIYESAPRIQKTIQDIVKHMGNRYIVVSRELTKMYEEIIRGDASDVLARIEDKPRKGEMVLLVTGNDFKSLE